MTAKIYSLHDIHSIILIKALYSFWARDLLHLKDWNLHDFIGAGLVLKKKKLNFGSETGSV